MSMQYRISRTLPADRVAIIIPVDHGLIFDRLQGLESPAKVIAEFAEQADGFMMSPGLVAQTESFFAERPHLSRVMAIDAFYPLNDAMHGTGTLISSVEDAVRLGVDCVKMLMPWNIPTEAQAALAGRIGEVVNKCEEWQIPLMLEPVLLGAERSAEVIATEEKVARIAFDLGAHIIKIAFPGAQTTQRLIEELGLPLVIAGGPLSGNVADTVEQARETVAAGARGLIVGRNVWQRPAPEGRAVMDQLRSLCGPGSRA